MINNRSNSKKVILWTRQDIKSLDDLKNNGVIRIKRKHLEEKFEEIADYIIKLYNWFTNEANKIVPKPKEVEFPIWCSISEENMLRPTLDTVVYVLEVDESEIIYFDGMKWDYVLNHLYIPKDEKDEEEYLKDIKRKGFKDAFSVMDEKIIHFYPEERKRIMDSWIRVFEIDQWDIFRIQANIWEIRSEMVKDVLYYKEV
ncbi:DUF3841 domain-containing protein [Clostridium sp. Cult1]|uniref:DUF3841 domain-containing protein n=1 Tax=Clostridium sp. Cult1 TaxID=2079002 RepID=UPI001F39CA32|nr:DUF3841 domain-containing protein [Clostridium sp. Cult1]MCF6463722.1 hypothetical protein [Clostridium sp. Cult1]